MNQTNTTIRLKGNSPQLTDVVTMVVIVVMYITMVTINALANILPINGKNTGQIADSYPNLFVPAGVTFSIWGVIYLLLLLYVSYQLYATYSKNELTKLKPNHHLVFALTCILNSLWLMAWHYEMIYSSVIIIIALLLSLIYLFLQTDQLNINSRLGRFAIKTTISVYLGWISVATIANITSLLVAVKWNGFGVSPNIYTIVVIAVGALLAILMLTLRKNIAYALVVIWAYMGIIIKRLSQDVVYTDIIYTCYLAIGIISIFIAITAINKMRAEKLSPIHQ